MCRLRKLRAENISEESLGYSRFQVSNMNQPGYSKSYQILHFSGMIFVLRTWKWLMNSIL